jgi:hypothetical protein
MHGAAAVPMSAVHARSDQRPDQRPDHAPHDQTQVWPKHIHAKAEVGTDRYTAPSYPAARCHLMCTQNTSWPQNTAHYHHTMHQQHSADKIFLLPPTGEICSGTGGWLLPLVPMHVKMLASLKSKCEAAW